MNNKKKAIIFMILSAFFFTTMNMLGKLSSSMNPYQKTFITNAIATFIVIIIIKKRNASFIGHKETRLKLLIRGFAGTVSICAFYFSLEHLYLSDATMLNQLSPFFTIIFSFVLLKEKLSKKQLICLLVAFLGCIFIVRPQFNSSMIPALLGIFAAITAGLAYTMIRSIGNKEDFFTVILSFSGIATIICFPSLFFHKSGLTTFNILVMIGAGLSFMIGQIFLTLSYRYAPASEVSMYSYIGLVIAAFYGFIIFGEIPDIYSIIGYVIIISASFVNLLAREKKC